MKFLSAILRVYAFVFHLALSAFLMGLAGIAYFTHQPLNLGGLPFPEENAIRDVTIFGLLGFLCALLALTRGFKFMFVLWAALVVYVMARVFFLSPYAFVAPGRIRDAAWLTLAAVAAFVGAAWSLKPRRRSAFL